MPAVSEQEEFEFRLRAEREAAARAPAERKPPPGFRLAKPGETPSPPVDGFSDMHLVYEGDPSAPSPSPWVNRGKVADSMLAAATAVPGVGLAAGAARAGLAGTRLAPYAARAAELMIPESLPAMGKMIGAAGLAGGTGEVARQMAEKAHAGPVGQTAAELVGGLLPIGAAGAARGGVKLGQKVADYYSRSRGAGVEAELNALRSAVRGPAEAAQGDLAVQLDSAQQRASAISRAQVQLGGREPVAVKRAAERAQAVERGLNALSPKRDVLPEDLGGLIQSQGRSNIKSLAHTRQAEAITLRDQAMQSAASREAGGDYMVYNPKSHKAIVEAVMLLKKYMGGTVEFMRGDLSKLLESIRGKQTPITMEQADNLRRMLTDKSLQGAEGFATLDISRRIDVANKLKEAIVAYEPKMGEYLKRYRELSAPIARATAGRGAALTEADLLAENEALYSADKGAATKYFLDGSQERAQRLLALVGKPTSELMSAVKGHFRRQMEGMSAEQMKKFIADHEGTLRVFKGIRGQVESVAQSQREFETAAKSSTARAGSAATRLTGEATEAQRGVKSAEGAAQRYEKLLNKLHTSVPEESVSNARSIADQLFKDGRLTSEEHRELLTQVAKARQSITDAKQAREVIANITRRAILYGLGGAGLGTAGYLGVKAVEGSK